MDGPLSPSPVPLTAPSTADGPPDLSRGGPLDLQFEDLDAPLPSHTHSHSHGRGSVPPDHHLGRSRGRPPSPLHRWHPRPKLVGLLALMFGFSTAQSLGATAIALAVAALLYGLSRLPWGLWRSRVVAPGWFVVALVAALPFIAGQTPLGHLGPVAIYQEGTTAALIILGRFLSLLTLALVLVETTPWLELVRALRRLGLSPILTDLLLLSYRYLADVADCWQRMVAASTLRGFQWRRLDRRRFLRLAALVGTLLIRSHDRAQRVYQAMRLRGYGQRQAGQRRPCDDRLVGPGHWLLMGLLSGLALAFAIAQIQA